MSKYMKFQKTILLLGLLVGLSVLWGCSQSESALSGPQADNDATPSSEEADTSDEVLEMIIRGTGTTEGNPAIVVIGFGERPTDPKIERSMEWNRVDLRINGAFLASSDQCDTEHGSVLQSHSGVFDFSLVGTESKRIRMFTEPTLEYCSLDFSLDDSDNAVILEGEHDNGTIRSLHTHLNGQLPFAPVGGRFAWDESQREHWIVVFDPDKLPEDDSNENLALDDSSNPVQLQRWREAFVGALGVYRDLDENGLIDENELTDANLVALGDPTRLSATWSGGDLTPIPSDDTGVFVAASPIGNDDAPGTMQQPVATIGRAVELASISKSIFVAGGEYPEAVTTMTSMYGGYEADTWTRNTGAHPSVIAAQLVDEADVGLMVGDITSASITINNTVSDRRITIQGFTVIAPVGAEDIEESIGIAVLNNTWTVLADNLVYTDSSLTYNSVTGIRVLRTSDTRLLSNRISMSHAAQAKGISLDENVTARLEDNQMSLQNNTSETGLYATSPRFISLRRNLITSFGPAEMSNLLHFGGGCEYGCQVEAANNLFLNEALCGSACPMVRVESIPCTLANNSFWGSGSAGSLIVEFQGEGNMTFANNIFRIAPATSSDTGSQSVFKTGSMVQLTAYNNLFHLPDQTDVAFVQGTSSTTLVDSVAALNACSWNGCTFAGGNLAGDPLLVDVSSGDFHLQPASPCIDSAMDPLLVGIRIWSDADGITRPRGEGYDIGPFEYDGDPNQHECPEVVNECLRRPTICRDNAIYQCQEHYDAFNCLVSTDYEDASPVDCGSDRCFDEPPSGVSAELMAICLEECTPCDVSGALLCLDNAAGGCRQWNCIDGCRTLTLDTPDDTMHCSRENNAICVSDNSCGPVLSVQPESIDFGCVPEENTVRKLVTMSNVGTADITIHSINFADSFGATGARLEIQGISLPLLLSPAEAKNFYVVVIPGENQEGLYENMVRILSSDCERPVRDIQVIQDCRIDALCTDQPDGSACDDGDVCTVNDACSAGVCVGVPLNCDDDNPCTDDACNASGGCFHTNNNAACDIGNPCAMGECRNGDCMETADPDCNDNNPCTDDYCSQETGCYHEIAPDGTTCTSERICQDGVCEASCTNDEDCQDEHACTTDVCDLASGYCRHSTDALSCDDSNVCTEDFCDPLDGCLHLYSETLCPENICPTVSAPEPEVRECTVGDRLALYGPISTDPDGTIVEGHWEIVEQPEGSQIEMTPMDPEFHNVLVTTDVEGTYRFAYSVRDNDNCWSEPVEVVLLAVDDSPYRLILDLEYDQGESSDLSTNLVDLDLGVISPDGYRCSVDLINSINSCTFPNGCGAMWAFSQSTIDGKVIKRFLVNQYCEGAWNYNVALLNDCDDWVDIFVTPFCAHHTVVDYTLSLYQVSPSLEEPIHVFEGTLDGQGDMDNNVLTLPLSEP